METIDADSISLDDEDNFPPLPRLPDSAIHSRVASIQSSHEARAGTPKVPPGFERSSSPKVPPGFEERLPVRPPPGLEELHAHPSRTEQPVGKPWPRKEGVAAPVVPVVPAVSIVPRSRKSSLKVESKQHESKSLDNPLTANSGKNEKAVDEADDATTVSDEPKQVVKQVISKAGERLYKSPPVKSQPEAKSVQETFTEKEVPVSVTRDIEDDETTAVKVEPSKKPTTDTELPKQEVSSPPAPVLEAREDAVLDDRVVIGTPDVLSQATTPPSKRPTPVKRPTLRTLNITSEMIAQSESQAPPSTTTERSTAFPTLSQIRQSSRQPSVSVTTSRPSTPAVSERLMSHDVSRAGSPPPSVVGSAPGRGKTKAQAKKERKDRAIKASEVSETGGVAAAPTPPAQEEVGPIVARQKKQKKSKPSSSAAEPSKAPKSAVLEDKRPVEVDRPPEPAPPVKKVSADKKKSQPKREPSPPPKSPSPPPLEPELPPLSYTLRDFYADTSNINYNANTGQEATDEYRRQRLQDILASRISTLQKLLAEMVQDGDIAKDHPLFNPPSFNSAGYKLPSDNRKGQAYLDGNNYNSSDVFGMVYLPSKEKKALYQGHAVSVADSGERADDLLRRCLITPGGWILRHLSREEGERVLDLEERRQVYLEDLGDIGRMDGLSKLEDNDYSNLEGGFDELSRFGERHGVCWVVGENDAAERGFRRARYGQRNTSNGLDDDYGLGEAPIGTTDFDDEDDQFDDPEDDDDEEELDGEEMVLDADVELDEEGYEINDPDMAFTDLSQRVILPPLPEMMSMPGSWDPTFNGPPYPSRVSQHGMYASLNPIGNSGYNYTSDNLDLPPPPPLPPTSQLPQLGSATRENTLPPMRHPHTGGNRVVNLRAMDTEQLEKRVKEKAREIEAARKEADKAEKLLAKKSKDAGRWRDGVLRTAQGLAS